MKNLRKILQQGTIIILTTLMLASPANASIIFQDDNFEIINSSGLLIDSKDQASGDIVIQFGETLGESLHWDDSSNWFEFSDDVSLSSNQLVDFRVENVSSLPGGASGLGSSGTGRMVQLTSTDSTAPGCTDTDCSPGTYVWDGTTWQAIGSAECVDPGFPVVESMTTNVFSTASTTHNVTMPSTVAEGDLLLAFFTSDGDATVTTPSGWTAVGTLTRATYARGSVYAKLAAGTEGGTTVNFATSAGEEAASQVYRISNWYGSIADGVDIQSYDPGGTTSTPNPASLTPSWDTDDTLWIAYAGGSSWTSVNAYPTNYTNGTHVLSNTGNAGASASTARRELNAASEDPSAFTMSSTNSGVVFTVAVRPAACGTTGGGGGTSGAVYVASGASEAESSTTSDTFQTKLTVSPTFTSGVRYRIDYQFELGVTGDSDNVYQVQVGGTPVCEGTFKNYPYATRYEQQAGFYYASDLSGTQDITIEYYLAYGTTAYIRKARIFVTAYPE